MAPISNQQLAKNLWRDAFALGSIIESTRHLNRIIQSLKDGDKDLYEVFWGAFAISYARPFSSNSDIGQISEKLVRLEYRHTHRVILDYRNGIIGHTDPHVRGDNGQQVNRLKFKFAEKGILPIPCRICPHEEFIPKVIDLVDSVYENLGNLIANIMPRVPEVTTLANGDYIFDFTQPEGKMFIPLDK